MQRNISQVSTAGTQRNLWLLENMPRYKYVFIKLIKGTHGVRVLCFSLINLSIGQSELNFIYRLLNWEPAYTVQAVVGMFKPSSLNGDLDKKEVQSWNTINKRVCFNLRTVIVGNVG